MQTLLQYLENDYNNRIDGKLKALLKQYSVKEIVAEIMSWILEKKTRYVDIMIFARDFYIGSDLTKKQGEAYYKELEWQGFFSLINNFLYDDDAMTCSWTIYTIGKFSRKENAYFLENAYENNYKSNNPFLAARCLFEMRWLESEKVEGFLEALKSDNSLFSNMTLLYFYEPTCNKEEMANLLKDKVLAKKLFPKLTLEEVEKEDIEAHIWAFERFIWRYCNTEKVSKFDPKVFENLVKTRFATAKDDEQNGYIHKPMKYTIIYENVEEYGMGGPYAGDCYAVDKHGVQTFLTGLAMSGAKQFGHQIFIPLFASKPIIESGGKYVLHRLTQLAIADMSKMELQILSYYYNAPLEIHGLENEKLSVSMPDGVRFEVELANQSVIETKPFSLPNRTIFKDYDTEGVVFLAAANRLKNHYATNELINDFPAGLNEVGEGQKMFWLNIYHHKTDLYLFDNQAAIKRFAQEEQCASWLTAYFFEENDDAVILNKGQFYDIMGECKGDISAYHNKGNMPIFWHRNLKRGFYELTYVEAQKGLALYLERVTDPSKMSEHHLKGHEDLW